MRNDVFVGVPYSVIMERGPDGRFIEMCNTPTNGNGGAMTEREMVKSYIERILK